MRHTTRVIDLRLGRTTNASASRDWRQVAIRARGILRAEDERTRDVARASRMLWSFARLKRATSALALALALSGCATTSVREDRGDGVCFLNGRCVPCEDLPRGCEFPPKVALDGASR